MKILSPVMVSDAVLLSSSVPETDHAEWSSVATYSIGQRVIRPSLHKAFESLTANTNKPPESNPTDWLDLGATNRWRMFDEKVGTQTIATESLVVELTPGIVNAVALLNLSARSVRVEMIDADEGTVFDRTISLYDPLGITSWYAYFFEPIRRKSSVVIAGLPSYRGATLRVTVSDAEDATVKVGVMVVGSLRAFSSGIEYGARVGIQDYSRKSTDDWGNSYVREGAYAKRAGWSFDLINIELDALIALLASLRSKPAVYIGSDLYDSTVVFGFYRDFDVVVAYPKWSLCSIEIEGLI